MTSTPLVPSCQKPGLFKHLRRPASAAAILLLAAMPLAALQASQTGIQRSPDELVADARDAVRRGDLEAAEAAYRQALARQPDFHAVRFELAGVMAFLGRFEEAGTLFGEVVEAMPQNGAARRGEATALIFQGRYAEARRKLEEGLSALPRDGQLAHTLARLVATAPEDEIRDGPLAVLLARMVYEVKKIYATGETLAMAYAEVGDFERAIETQQELISRAEAEGDEKQLAALRQRLELYREGKPWRAESPAEIAMATEP